MKYAYVCRSLVEYLLEHQISVNNKKIALKDGRASLSINFNKKEGPFTFDIVLGSDGLYIISSREIKRGPFKENKLFALNPYDAPSKFSFGVGKLEIARRFARTSLTILRHIKEGRMDYENRMLIKDFIGKFRKNSVEAGGLVFSYQLEGNEIIFKCHDNGGILDTRANAEGRSLAPSAMGCYYADAYAAYCFAVRFKETNNKKYLQASISALEFVERTYENYPKSVVWYHHDFKNPAYIETLLLIKDFISREKYEELYRLVPLLREDLYEPTNVYALRYHWRLARESLGFREQRRIRVCLKRLEADQTRDGLIHDNNPGGYDDAHDLTYHQYSLACIALGLAYSGSAKAIDIFKKGCDFSYNILTKDGEVAYNGRGANSIYHLASAIYAFEFAANLFKETKFRAGARKMFEYLIKWRQEEGYFPVAMNPYVRERMAWNHCHTPYNALVCYLLYKAHSQTSVSDLEPEKKAGLLVMDEAGYATFINKTYSFIFFSGCSESYPWSEGCHKTGYAGTAILGINSIGATNLILDKYLKDGVIATDIPLLELNSIKIEPYGRGKLRLLEENTVEYSWNIKDRIKFIRTYRFEDNEIYIRTALFFMKDAIISSAGLIALPLSVDYGWQVDVCRNKVVQKKDGIKLNYRLDRSELAGIIEIKSNPRGRGKLILFSKLNKKQVKKGDKLDYEYSISIEK